MHLIGKVKARTLRATMTFWGKLGIFVVTPSYGLSNTKGAMCPSVYICSLFIAWLKVATLFAISKTKSATPVCGTV